MKNTNHKDLHNVYITIFVNIYGCLLSSFKTFCLLLCILCAASTVNGLLLLFISEANLRPLSIISSLLLPPCLSSLLRSGPPLRARSLLQKGAA